MGHTHRGRTRVTLRSTVEVRGLPVLQLKEEMKYFDEDDTGVSGTCSPLCELRGRGVLLTSLHSYQVRERKNGETLVGPTRVEPLRHPVPRTDRVRQWSPRGL